jgi:hypothetical protein
MLNPWPGFLGVRKPQFDQRAVLLEPMNCEPLMDEIGIRARRSDAKPRASSVALEHELRGYVSEAGLKTDENHTCFPANSKGDFFCG